MFLAEFTTKSGKLYTVNVVNRRYKTTKANGEESEWADYKELRNGTVGDNLTILLPEDMFITTTEVVKLQFPKVGG
jgi:uncharacterized protein (DUF2344 family)